MKLAGYIWSLLSPFLLACLPVLLLLQRVRGEILPEETFASVVAVELFAVVCVLVALAIFRSVHKAAVAASACIAFTFAYRVWQVCLGLYLPINKVPYLGLASVAAFFAFQALIIYALLNGTWRFAGRDIKMDFKRMCYALTAVSLLLVAGNWMQIYLFEGQQEKLAERFKTAMAKPFSGVKLDARAGRPDIYYIILDGYASPLTMFELWNYKDDRLAKYLYSKGFYIASSAASNYDRTEYSLASSLNMQYLNPLVQPGDAPPPFAFMRLVQDSQVLALLRGAGYKFIQLSSGAFGTDTIPEADKIVRVNYVNHFFRALAYLTPWSEIEAYCPVLSTCIAQIRLSPGTELDQLTSPATAPKFVLIHTDLPHAPYLFDENGKQLPLPPGLIPDWQPPERYFGQWKFCQSQLITWIDRILKATDGRAIIIVQSDHGPGIRLKPGEINNWYNERMRIFNAYYLPGHTVGLYPSITPVNSFRVVFNDYFKAGLPMLKDISYCPHDPQDSFDWQDVTALLKFPPTSSQPQSSFSPVTQDPPTQPEQQK